MSLEIVGARKAFGSVRAVDGVELSVVKGEFFALLGPSGCGKTTLLRMIAGIHPIDAGSVTLNGRDITRLPMHRRNLAMVFQSYALFPHLTAFDNVAFGLRSRKIGAEDIKRRVAEALALVRLEALASRYPAQMSGGQQQRVALARALAVRPDLLLLDEPLSNLDARLRDEMRLEIRDLQRRLGITTILVTHDISEAFTMSDRMGVMQEGKILQIGRAADIYNRPFNRFIANFVGPINELALTKIEKYAGRMKGLANGELPVWLPESFEACPEDGEAGELRLILRPENLHIDAAEGATDNSFAAEIEDMVFLGGGTECRIRIGSLKLLATLPSAAATLLRPGGRVRVGWNAEDGVVTRGR
jgi:putative spermidine/putrescine transport system ATP-binding protein